MTYRKYLGERQLILQPTGEYRLPKKFEWFVNMDGEPQMCNQEGLYMARKILAIIDRQ